MDKLDVENIKEINISDWYGRLGNQIVLISYLIKFALLNKINLSFPQNRFFNTKSILFCREKYESNQISTIKAQDLWENKVANINLHAEYNQEIINESREILRDVFLINAREIEPLREDDLVIHIRSGDVFDLDQNTVRNIAYIPPPNSYYQELIKKTQPKEIYLIHEDNRNPSINFILNNYPNSKSISNQDHKEDPLERDIKFILSAQSLAQSCGTFAHALGLISQNLKNIYNPKKFYYDQYFIDAQKLNKQQAYQSIISYEK